MAKTLTATDRKSLIRLASTMGKGSPERKAVLAGLSKAASHSGGRRVTGAGRPKSLEVTLSYRDNGQPVVSFSNDPTEYARVKPGKWVTSTGLGLHRDVVPFVEWFEKQG